MELQILHLIQELHCEWLDSVMIFFSMLGDNGFIWILLSIVLAIIPRTRKCGLTMMLSMALTFLLCNLILKNVIARPRPFAADQSVTMLVPLPTDFSFPSGHTANGFAAAVSVFAYYCRSGVAALVFAGLIAFSRMYLFVHYPTDILGGIVLGTLDACFVIWCVRKYAGKRRAV